LLQSSGRRWKQHERGRWSSIYRAESAGNLTWRPSQNAMPETPNHLQPATVLGVVQPAPESSAALDGAGVVQSGLGPGSSATATMAHSCACTTSPCSCQAK